MIVPGAVPRLPLATSMTRSATARKPSWNAAQCSRSTFCRTFSPEHRPALAPRAGRDRFVPRLEQVQAGRQQERQRRPDQHVVEAALQLAVEPGHLLVVEDRPLLRLQHPCGPRVHHDEAGRADVAGVAPPVGLGILVGPLGQRVEEVTDVGLVAPGVPGRHDLLPDLVLGALVRREIAQVLVDPVRRQTADDPVVPPAGRLHLLAPRGGRVPVVADVVVVEDHRAGKGREQPAVGGVGPRQLVEVRVLREVLELLAGRFVDVTPRRDELPHLVRGLVGVHLVAEEQHHVRPPALVLRHLEGVRAHRVDAVAPVAGGVVRDAGPAGPERQPEVLAGLQRRDPARWVRRVRRWPHLLVVDRDGVVLDRPGIESFHRDERVVVVVRCEGRARSSCVLQPRPGPVPRRGS